MNEFITTLIEQVPNLRHTETADSIHRNLKYLACIEIRSKRVFVIKTNHFYIRNSNFKVTQSKIIEPKLNKSNQ